MILLILTSILVTLLVVHYVLHNTGKGKLLNKIVGPMPYLIIGNAWEFLHGTNIFMFQHFRTLANKYKKGYRLWAFNKKVINLIDPDDIEIVMSSSKHIEKSDIYNALRPWLNDGLLTSTGEKWHSRRKVLTPTFHFNILNEFCGIFSEHSKKLVENLKSEIGNPETNIQPYVTKVALHSICETAMGTNLDTTKNSNSYVSSIYKFGEFFLYRTARVWLFSDALYSLTKVGKLQENLVKTLHDFTTNVISERRKERQVFGNKLEITNEFENSAVGSKKRMAMLDLLLSAEEEGKINNNGIREEVDTFMFEGHDTVTMAMTFCLMLLANNPEQQEQAYLEIQEILGDSETTTIQDLNNMQYLERCIKESLRIYPSVPFIGRTLNEDVQLKNFFVPAGTSCNIHIFDLHRNEKYFPNPEKYDPDRFLPENSANRHPYVYIPFSAGPRNCIGQKYALLELKSIISAILRNYKLEAVTRPEDMVFIADLVLRSDNPVKVKLLPRK